MAMPITCGARRGRRPTGGRSRNAGVGLEPGQVVAGLQVHDAAVRVEPVHADLAGHAAVVAPHDAFGDAFATAGPRPSRWPARRRPCSRPVELGEREHGLALGRGPFGIGLGRRAEHLAGLRVDGPADGVLGLELVAPFQHERVQCPADQICRTIFIGDQPQLLLAVQSGHLRKSPS